jgi:uncharacterized membrane protein YphA (DoxX/SURF4 family)
MGLLFMRLLAGGAAIHQGFDNLQGASLLPRLLLQIIEVSAGTFLLWGLWTPIAGTLIAIIAVWSVFSGPGDPWTFVLLVALGVGLAMVGPGAWSIDSRLFGRKRLDLADRH